MFCFWFWADERHTGFDPLEPYCLYGFNNEIDMTCGYSLAAVDLQLYQLIDRALNPWLQFNDVAVLLNDGAKSVVDDELAHCTRLTLTGSEFLRVAVPMFNKCTKTKDDCLDESISLIHYDDRLRKLLDVQLISVSLWHDWSLNAIAFIVYSEICR